MHTMLYSIRLVSTIINMSSDKVSSDKKWSDDYIQAVIEAVIKIAGKAYEVVAQTCILVEFISKVVVGDGDLMDVMEIAKRFINFVKGTAELIQLVLEKNKALNA